MRELGYLESRDYVFEDRYADGDVSRLPLLAEELVKLKPDVIVAATTAAVLAAKQVTASIPIVGVNVTDPVGFGFAASEARPGANVTGILFRLEGLTEKQVEIALDLMPGTDKMGVLVDVTNAANLLQRREVEAAAVKLAVSIARRSMFAPWMKSVLRFKHLCASARASWSFWRLRCSSLRADGSRALR